MTKLIGGLIAGLFLSTLAVAAEPAADAQPPAAQPAASAAAPDSEQLEKELQSLSWPQFKSVVSAIPKLKADVDAYGPLGWQYVQANYKTYKWKKNINKLDDAQKEQLAALIQKSRHGAAN